jgi:monoamine oxidase
MKLPVLCLAISQNSVMAQSHAEHIIVVGAGAAGLMAARELARAGRKVTILEAQDRCGGRILSLPQTQFGYAAEGGPEFVHGEAPVTCRLLREAQLSLVPLRGTRWIAEKGTFSRRQVSPPHEAEFHNVLRELTVDMTVTQFFQQHFAGPEYEPLRRSIQRTVEGYDAADPSRASILALREEWMNDAPRTQGRISGGYGAVIGFLADDCRRHGAVIHLGAVVSSVDLTDRRMVAHCADGSRHAGDTVVLAVPVPLLKEIALPARESERAAAAAHIGYGNVIKLLLRFRTHWWGERRSELGDLSFLISDQRIPVWWTQRPAEQAVLTGWFGGPKTETLASLSPDELVEVGLASLAGAFGLSSQDLAQQLVAARALNWAHDPFARGAYSYVTPETRKAVAMLADATGSAVYFSGEAMYLGPDMGTVEAALTSGLQTARTILG